MPIGQPKAPADKGAPKTAGAAKPKTLGTSSVTAAREEGLNGIAQIGTALLILSKNYADAGAVDMHAEAISHEVAVLAEDNENIGNIIDRITAMGPYAGLLTAVMPLAMQLLVNHDRIQANAAGLFGGSVMSKEALAAKVSADIDKKKTEFLRQAAEAQKEAAEAQAQLARVAA
jgi:hypothetical protein